MTEEEKNKVYKEAFDYVCKNWQRDESIICKINLIEQTYELEDSERVEDILRYDGNFKSCLEQATDVKTEQEKVL